MSTRSFAKLAGFVLLIVLFAGPAQAALIDNGDGTVTDNDLYGGLGLMWLKESHDEPMTWSQAMAWAENLDFADYTDWRLPSAVHFTSRLPDTVFNSVENEWGHLYGVEWDDPESSEDIDTMEGYTCPWYWTKTENTDNPSQAYAFFVSYAGIWVNLPFDKSQTFCVTAVRGPEIDILMPPIARFNQTKDAVVTGGTIEFDPSTSFDPDGSIVLYEWDCDGDGVFEIQTTTPDVIECTFAGQGEVVVTLRVTDNDGLTATASAVKIIWNPFFAWIPLILAILVILAVISIVGQVYTYRKLQHGKVEP